MSATERTSHLNRAAGPPPDGPAVPRRTRVRRALIPFAYLAPTLVLLGVFDIYPIIFGFWISLWRWGIRAEEFVGLANYRRLLDESFTVSGGSVQAGEMGQSLMATFYYAIGTVPLVVVISFVIANFLFQKIKFLALFRTAFFLPYITSTVAAGLAFTWIFHPQVGVANAILGFFGVSPQRWLLDPEPVLVKLVEALGGTWPAAISYTFAGPSLAMVCVIVFSVWNTLGFAVVIMLAGLTSVNSEVLEAAQVDGATPLQTMRKVTLPLMSPTIFFVFVITTIQSFQSFSQIYALTGGGQNTTAGSPLNTTMTLTIYMFRNLYERISTVGYASAVSMVLFVLLALLTLIQFRVVGRRVHYQ